MAKLDKLTKVGEAFTAYRYENGFMFEITGRDKKDDWKTLKIICNTESDLLELIKEYNTKDLDN